MTGLNLSPSQCVPTEKLAAIYRIRFELGYLPEPTLPNDDYPDVLGPAHRALNWDLAHHQQVYDVGSANFANAAALQAFFHSSHLIGTEVNGHRLYCNGRSRIDYAYGHIRTLPHTNYAVTDYRQYKQPRRNHSCLGSLRHSQTALGLALFLRLFDPVALFAHIANNLV
jgi:hypothetical protein